MFLISRYSRTFRRATWLAVLAIMLQMLVPLVHHPVQAMMSGGVLRICSSLANQTPASPTDTNKSPTHKLPPCPICQNLQLFSGGFVPPHAVVLALLFHDDQSLAPSSDKPVVCARVLSNAQPRAPPVLT